jgi:16S rRNA (guanine527-N7)-methyltransferase
MHADDPKGIWFRSLCALNQLPLGDTQVEQLQEYTGLLLRWNRKVNLISRKDEENIWERHILHSASLLFNVSISSAAKAIDLGTGGGLPGIPIKILAPALSIVLVDSVKKKAQAVADIVDQLSLTNVNVECSRAEQLGTRPGFYNEFDYVTARGVAELNKLALWSFPLLKLRGTELPNVTRSDKLFVEPPALLAMKGGDLRKEIRGAKRSADVRDIQILDLEVKGLEQVQNPDRKVAIVYFQ